MNSPARARLAPILHLHSAPASRSQVWLAAVKLESETNEPERARILLAKARERAGTERVWMKSVVLERNLGEMESALSLLAPALRAHPKFWKLHLLKAQVEGTEGTLFLSGAGVPLSHNGLR